MKILKMISIFFCMASTALSASAVEKVIFDFETDAQGWEVPDWASEQKDCVASNVGVGSDKAFEGKNALKADVDFPGNKWTQAVVEVRKDMDLTGYRKISAEVYLPKKVKDDLIFARIILTIGPWHFVEMTKNVHLESGRWTKISAPLNVNEADQASYWKCRNKDECIAANIHRVRKIAVRIEYNASDKNFGVPYKGPVYIDNIVIE